MAKSRSIATTQICLKGQEIRVSGISGEYVFEKIKASNTFYEADLLKFTDFATADSMGLILDVGANLGNHALYFAATRDNPIYCLEPSKLNFLLLRKNILDNHFGRQITAFNAAAWNVETSLQLDLAIEGNLGTFKSVASETGSVPGVSLDSLVGAQKVAMLKVDVEGAELRVLQGASAILDASRPLISAEVHSSQDLWALNNLILPKGYVPAGIFGLSDNFVWFHPDSYPGVSSSSLVQQFAVFRERSQIRLLRELGAKR